MGKELTYELLEPCATGYGAIKCLKCGMVSHNHNDVFNRYCGCCHTFHTMENGEVCDFCNGQPVTHSFFYSGFIHQGVLFEPGEWGLCPICVELAAEGDVLGLAERVIQIHLRDGHNPKAVELATLPETYQALFAHKTTSVRRIE